MIECCASLGRKIWRIVIVALAAIALSASNVSAQSPLGSAQGFAVLAGTAVTCSNSMIHGDVGVVLGTFTPTICTVDGTFHPGASAQQPYADFLAAYDVLADSGRYPCTGSLNTAYTDATLTLAPGVYCNNADVTFTRTTLTLNANGDPNAVWIFKIGTLGTGALTGTSLSVVLAGGGQACNVYWWLAEAGTITTSTPSTSFKGNILAGADITSTDARLIGNLLAGGAGQASLPTGSVTLTRSTVTACGANSGGGPGDDDDGDDDGHHGDNDHDNNCHDRDHHHKHPHHKDHGKDDHGKDDHGKDNHGKNNHGKDRDSNNKNRNGDHSNGRD